MTSPASLAPLFAVQRATSAARARTGHPIGVGVEQGRYTVSLFHPLPNGEYDQQVLASDLSLNAAIDFLNAYGV